MKWGVVTFPGSNDDRDALYCLEAVLGQQAVSLWHKDRDLKGVDAIVLPGGFSYGDYLRCGALARFSPVMQSVSEFAEAGGPVIGMCNGFQILCEAGLLPGALVRNRSLSFICEWVRIRVETTRTRFTAACHRGEILRIPIKHGEGCYVADEMTLQMLEDNDQVVFRYVNEAGEANEAANPNGALHNIAGVTNARGNVVGLMPHPEHAVEPLLGGKDGRKLFYSVISC
ncbi:MAG: phosphoribosylformylglycinamidine synthase subunit PurQ [Deltaproteobacteria bacterium]|nr:phosphoribosylformylglycinamidine synthase subunit PurQ [Deltaproteobacteria bacterium]